MKSFLTSLRPRRDGARLIAATTAATALLFSVLAMPASAGTTLVSGTSVFNTQCQAPVGGVPGNLGDYPAIDFSGSLDGCWYTYVATSQFNPSGTYIEQGTELFVGCLNGTICGTFETVYTFTGKYTDDTFTTEIHGRCEHSIVGGTGDFANAKGVINFKDDVVNMIFNYRGQIQLSMPSAPTAATVVQDGAGAREATGPTRVGGC